VIPVIYDKVFEEGKKEEKKAAPPKKGGKDAVVEEVVVEKEVETVDYTESLHKGPRKYSTLDLHYNL
jgi:hypothetical protein